MAGQAFSRLNPVSFLQTLLTQGLSDCDEAGGQAVHYQIARLAEGAASCFEEAYRSENSLAEPLNLAGYAEMITGIKNQIGGNFARSSSPPGAVRVINHRCPFGESVREAPGLCQMTSGVFGNIAARNFGWARVVLEKRIATGDGCCSVAVYTDPKRAPQGSGQDYEHATSSYPPDASAGRVQERLRAAWCRNQGDPEGPAMPAVVAESSAMQGVLETVEIAAPTLANVLVSGETGTGKEVIARAIHALGPRGDKRFVPVNCGAIPAELFGSLLFGHERGAFTGAYEVHHGYFEQAAGGTLFLDEVDTLAPLSQAKLLRVLQEGQYERIGGTGLLHSDARVIAASNADLEQLVADGRFRSDLYYRLNVIPIAIPPLRQRLQDLDALVDHLLDRLQQRHGRGPKHLGPRAWAQALGHSWPGNVRELENVLERGFLFAQGTTVESLPINGQDARTGSEKGEPKSLGAARREVVDLLEARIVRNTLARFGGDVQEAARSLNLSPRSIQLKVRAHKIEPARFRSSN